MAASSPSATKSTSETITGATISTAAAMPASVAKTTTMPPPLFQRMDALPKTQRGLNKPKCIQCGNVARSRCPYRSCKSCCSKAQNPCQIHVLKSNSAFQEKSPTSSAPSDQKSTQASSQVTPLRVPSARLLSNAFAQFENLQVRPKKHLTRKDAIALNDWRFSKLDEFKDGNIEIENDAFDRYTENISLLEEVFSINSVDEGSDENEGSKPIPTSEEDENSLMISGLKLTLKSDPVRIDNARKRIKLIVDQGIEKFRRTEANDGANDSDDQNKVERGLNKVNSLQVDRASVLSDIVDKLNKARNKEDLKLCSEMKAKLYKQSPMSTETEMKDFKASNKESAEAEGTPRQVEYQPFPKLLTAIEIDPETFNKIDAHFTTLEQIEDL